MPRFLKLRSGHDWLWTDVERAEDMIESFARTIVRDEEGCSLSGKEPTERNLARVRDAMKVYRFHESHRLAGEVSRLEYQGGRNFWVASRDLA